MLIQMWTLRHPENKSQGMIAYMDHGLLSEVSSYHKDIQQSEHLRLTYY